MLLASFSVLVLCSLWCQAAAHLNPCFNGGRHRQIRHSGHRRHRHRRAAPSDIPFPVSPFVNEEHEIAIDAEIIGGMLSHCLCDYRYDGIRCEHRVYSCGRGEKVHEEHSGREYCRCDKNWSGEDCVTPVCENGMVDDRGERCLCAQGWTGTHCNIPVCGTFGVFVEDHCECDDGYQGRFCERSSSTTLAQAATWSAAFSFPLVLVIVILRMLREKAPTTIYRLPRSNESTKSLISVDK